MWEWGHEPWTSYQNIARGNASHLLRQLASTMCAKKKTTQQQQAQLEELMVSKDHPCLFSGRATLTKCTERAQCFSLCTRAFLCNFFHAISKSGRRRESYCRKNPATTEWQAACTTCKVPLTSQLSFCAVGTPRIAR